MSNKICIMTLEGAAELSKKLEQLKSIDRPRVIAAISEARGHGDLKENGEYHAAREEQGFIEARIADIEETLNNSQIVDVRNFTNQGKVIFGSTVTLLNMDTAERVVYKIVGIDEADLKEQKISVSSPLARSLIGKYVDDIVDVSAPGGEMRYEIVDVQYL